MHRRLRGALCYGEDVTLLVPSEEIRTRPAGVRVIAIASFAMATLLVLDAVLVTSGVFSLASGRYLIGEYTTMGPAIFFVVAGALIGLGIGLQRGWSFARRLAIVAAALFLATSALPLSAAVGYLQITGIVVHGGKIIVAIIAIRYLLQPEVVQYFSARSGR